MAGNLMTVEELVAVIERAEEVHHRNADAWYAEAESVAPGDGRRRALCENGYAARSITAVLSEILRRAHGSQPCSEEAE